MSLSSSLKVGDQSCNDPRNRKHGQNQSSNNHPGSDTNTQFYQHSCKNYRNLIKN